MSVSLTISTVLVANMGKQSMFLQTPITCKTTAENKIVDACILLDSGAGGMFMDSSFAKKTWNPSISPRQNNLPSQCRWNFQPERKNHPLYLDPISHRNQLVDGMTPHHWTRKARRHFWTTLVPGVQP